ncbi:phage tail tape measure protein [Paenibacillus wulumuqiensis]|uniref:phage tail tape measure protein n=1 Tax=Paenibacillus wulumuqiensis TaxID=1567107 RepID=UPI000698FBAE|nr:phage tail tape measure protein [Paenibacillus wulumuqiensis]
MSFDIRGTLRLVDRMSSPLRGAMGTISKFTAAGAGLGLAGIGIAGALGTAQGAAQLLGDSMSKAMDFEAQIDSVAALDKSLAKGSANYDKLTALALEMGAKTSYSALEAAQGMEELIKAGLSAKQVMGGGLEAALNLAAAGSIEVADAASVMSIAMNAFKQDGMSAADAANILASTANASATGVNELKYGIAAVGSVAGSLGMTFKETAASVGIFANNGLSASDGGTSLKTMLANLQPMTKKTRILFDELGWTVNGTNNKFFDAAGNLKDLTSIAGILNDTTKNMTKQDRGALFRDLFGSDAVRAATIFAKEGAEGVAKFLKQVKEGPTALEVAKAKLNNAKGAVEQLSGAFETFQISALTPMMPAIKEVSLGLADMFAGAAPQVKKEMESVGKGVTDWMEKIRNNPAYKNAKTLSAKIDFVFKDLSATFSKWYNEEGKAKLTKATEKIATFVGGVLKDAAPTLGKVGLQVGGAIVAGMMQAIKENFNPLAAIGGSGIGGAQYGANVIASQNKLNNTPDGKPVLGQTTLGTGGAPKSKWESALDSVGDAIGNGVNWVKYGSHAGGLDKVPYNGYKANLHKDETVLTKGEAADYRSGKSGKGSVVIEQVIINNEQDYQAFLTRLTNDLAKLG